MIPEIGIWAATTILLFLMKNADGNNITVRWIGSWDCTLEFQGHLFPCSLGVNGVSANKMEGDGKTPLGNFPLRRAFYRKDRGGSGSCYNVASYLNCEATLENYGWVDEPSDKLYNQFVYLPYNASHEQLYLSDSNAYDLMAVIGYNDNPIVPYKGSAIFFHVAGSDYHGTAGCVAMSLSDLSYVLQRVTPETWMTIQE